MKYGYKKLGDSCYPYIDGKLIHTDNFSSYTTLIQFFADDRLRLSFSDEKSGEYGIDSKISECELIDITEEVETVKSKIDLSKSQKN